VFLTRNLGVFEANAIDDRRQRDGCYVWLHHPGVEPRDIKKGIEQLLAASVAQCWQTATCLNIEK
jgi:hypothetical protein